MSQQPQIFVPRSKVLVILWAAGLAFFALPGKTQTAPVDQTPPTQTAPSASLQPPEQSFYADTKTCTAGNTPGAFAVASGVRCAQGRFAPAKPGHKFQLVQPLADAGASSSGYAVQFQMTFNAPTNNARVGFNAGASAKLDRNRSLELTASTAGFGLLDNGSNRVLWTAGGNPPAPGMDWSTGSGQGNGWAPPAPGLYDVSLFSLPDGTCIASYMHSGGVNNSASFHVPCSPPAQTGMQSLTISGAGAGDAVGPVAEAHAPATHKGGLVVPRRSSAENIGAVLRWAVHADGSECKYDGTERGPCQNIFVFVPPSYMPQDQNKWVMVLHGNREWAIQAVLTDFDRTPADPNIGNLSDRLYQAGYTIVAIDNISTSSYGSPEAVKDVANAAALVKEHLDLAPQPYLISDSMGGFVMLNAVAHGVVSPPAMIGYSPNISLSWAAVVNAQMPFVATAFGFTTPTCKPGQPCTESPSYATATAGYDPLLTAKGTDPNLDPDTAKAMQARLAAVPTLLIADPSDGTVNTNDNSTFYFNAINAIHPDTVIADFNHLNQGHVGIGLTNGAQAVDFFNKH